MMLLFQTLCLCVTLVVLQNYIVAGVYSRMHRLLPLVLGLIGVYNFCEIILVLSNEQELISKMKDLLLIQMMYLLLHYMLDVLHMKLPHWVEGFFFLILITTNIVVFLLYDTQQPYRRYFYFYVVVFSVLILVFGTYTYLKYSYTKNDHYVSNRLYLAFLLPVLAVFFEKITPVHGNILVALSLAIACLIILYLMRTGRLLDTELLLQEKVFDTSEIAMVLFDADCYYIAANLAAKKIFPEELTEELRPGSPYFFMEKIKRMATQTGERTEVKRGECYYQCQLDAIFCDGKRNGYVLSIFDITQQKQKMQKMEALKDEAEAQTAEKSRFLARISHDLRSPLFAIMGISDILLGQRSLTEWQKMLVQNLKGAGNTLMERVNSILVYSRLEAGKLELAEKSYNLEEMIKEMAGMCAINLRSKPVNLTVSFLGEHPAFVIGDEMQVREMLQNVLANAVKYTEQGEIRCEIGCEMNQDATVCIRFCVTDTGPGISSEQLKKLFLEYVSFSGEKGMKGNGLGLPIVKQLAELMGGFAEAKSDGKSGSSVSVVFYQKIQNAQSRPAVTFCKKELMWHSAKEYQPITPSFVYPDVKVLAADDMRVNLEIFKELVRPWQFQVDLASCGEAAIDAAKMTDYQLIFLDQMMPEMTGAQTAEKLQQFCSAPLIMLTADVSENTRKECQKSGFSDFLAKPIDLSALQKILEKYLPESKRRNAACSAGNYFSNYGNDMGIYRRTLEIFVEETESLMEQLADYALHDMELFRIKVHGIKGISRQLGKETVSESAEILEMAAKTGNQAFIRSHLDGFLRELKTVLLESRQELTQMPEALPEVKLQKNLSTEEIDAMFDRLAAGFDNYNTSEIERILKELETASHSGNLTTEQENYRKGAQEALEELDYEKGSAIFRKI